MYWLTTVKPPLLVPGVPTIRRDVAQRKSEPCAIMSALDKVADTGAWGHSPLLQSNIPQVKLIWIPGDKDITVRYIDKKVDQPPDPDRVIDPIQRGSPIMTTFMASPKHSTTWNWLIRCLPGHSFFFLRIVQSTVQGFCLFPIHS